MTESERSERQAFEALVRRHQAQVCAVAYAVLRDRGMSQEVAQDAFLIAWRDREAVTPNVRWICGIARNLARNAARRHRETPMIDDAATTARDARDELITRENAARAEAALAKLPERYREAVVLYYGGEQSIADVADALGISQDSARQRVHRGRKRLRDLFETVETTLRATRPTAKFTAACVAAWAAGKPVPAHASAIPKRPLLPVAGAGVFALAASIAVVAVSRHRDTAGSATEHTAATTTTSDPRAALHRRFPASPRAVSPATLPAGSFVLSAPPTTTTAPASPAAPSATTVDFDFRQAPLVDLIHVFSNQLETPMWIAYDTDAKVDINTHGKQPIFDVLDEVLDKAGANRAEVAAIQIAPDGRTDATALGGEPVTLSVRNMPLNYVLDAIEPKLGMPIGRLGSEAIRGTVDENGNPLVDESPSVTLELRGVSAGAALEQALTQAHVGYELTTGFVILPR